MRIPRNAATWIGAAMAAMMLAAPAFAAAGDEEADRAARWKEVQATIFGDRKVETGAPLVQMDLPVRAEDASLVPLTLRTSEADTLKSVYLVVDDNPAPLAAHVVFGPAVDPTTLKLRIRINTYTNVHAVAETKDGRLVETAQFVKASGGCSAPMGMSDEEAMQGMGDMRMKFAGAKVGQPIEATLMIRHPNFTGLQMNQVKRDYTPARYITRIDVRHGDESVFAMDGDISISANPVINFAMLPEGKGPINVVAEDNQGGRWERSFDAPMVSH